MAVSSPFPRVRAAAGGLPSRLRTAYGLRALAGETNLAMLVACAVSLGLVVRLQYILAAGGLPINDGGMFFAMTEDIRRAGYALPEYTSYNGGAIPFAYSPLGSYLAAVLADVGVLSVMDSLRFLPLLASVLTIPAFFLLARAILRERRLVLLATFLFALSPRAYNWEIAGGGLTRSFGFLFAVLAIYYLYRMTREPSALRTVVATALVALTALFHLEMAVFAGISYLVILGGYGRTRRHLLQAAAVALGAALLTAPWWGTVIAQHGLEPFLAASQTGKHSLVAPLRLLFFDYTQEPFLPLLALLGLIGALGCLASRQYFLPAWLVVLFALDPRKAPTDAAVPLAMLAAVGTLAVLLPQLERLREAGGRVLAPSRWVAALPVFFVLYLFLSSATAPRMESSPLRAMSRQDVEMMRWARANTPADSRFLVLAASERELWTVDAVSEWFPALTGRVSLATVQGTEWLRDDRGMVASIERYEDLKVCGDRDPGCLDAWAREAGVGYTHVYVGKAPDEGGAWLASEGLVPRRDCCAALRAELAASAAYDLVYDGENGQIFALQPSLP